MQPDTSRQAYLDWLRTLAILGVLFFHSAMPYVSDWGWHIKNAQRSNLLLEMNYFLHSFRMPLLFFISGTVSYYMLQKRSAGGFIGLRFRRLFVPLIFGMLVIVPPQVYMERLTEGYHGSFWSFYPSIFTTGAYPQGNLSWHHLWFILYLVIYDLLFAPVFSWILSAGGRGFLRSVGWLAKGRRVYLILIPGLVLSAFSTQYPETNDLIHDWLFFSYWLCFLLAGFICIAQPRLMDSLERNRRFSLALAVLSLLVCDYVRWNRVDLSDGATYVFFAIHGLLGWAWVVAIVGYGKKYLNRRLPIQGYLNQAIYPFYILHQTVIVILTYYIVQTNESIGDKYIFTVMATFFISVSLYHLFVRPFAITRFLFGMKPAQPTRPKPHPAGGTATPAAREIALPGAESAKLQLLPS